MTEVYNRPLNSPLHERPSSHYIQHHFIAKDFQNSENKQQALLNRPYEGNGWNRNQPPSPMTDDKSGEEFSTIKGNVYQTRQENMQKPLREQLPPLSSLFGSSSSQTRPAQSPYSDRNSPIFPTFPTTSPNDVRHPGTPTHPDRTYESSYFQRPQVPRQYSHGSRIDLVERQDIPTGPQPGPLGRPESPRYEGRAGILDIPRPQAPGSVNGWSPHSQSSRSEYFSREEAPASIRTSIDHQPQLIIHRHEPDVRASYRNAAGPSSYPSTPASTISGDLASKDALGPKIWTGTQFLPRFVKQAEVPGEGMCYFYDDGTHCKTVIDGEVVNAHWGVTKAGKPRKRLAIACITCREKKIKCDPDYPRCVQCEKFGRICKFKNAPRGGQGSPDTPPADHEDIAQRPASSRAETGSFQGEKRENSLSASPREILRPGTPESEGTHSKRQRTGYSEYTPMGSEASPRSSVMETAVSPPIPWSEPLINTPIDPNLSREWHTNPFTANPGLVTELMAVVFKHVPETAYCMFPEGPFKSWVLSHAEKSADDLMLIYTILALATVFSPKAEHKPLGAHYAAISRFACDSRNYTLQLVQSRLILALYSFASNKPNDAWDFCGSAMRTACGLKLNLEMEKTDDAKLTTFPYGLNRSGYAESRRRTFWSCYNMDRYNGFCSGRLCMIQSEDIFLRLPCDFTLFESQAQVQAPFFDPATPPLPSSTWTIGSMAYLINITTIWGDVMANIYRSAQRPVPATSNSAFLKFYESVLPRLHDWVDSLPPSYVFSPSNLKIAADSGKLGTFMTMHTVYHTIQLKLHRHIQKSLFSPAQLAHHVTRARQHAESIIAVIDALAARRSATTPSRSSEHDIAPGKFSSPFLGYAILSAIDVLSSEFPLAAVPTLLSSWEGSLSILVELANFWNSSRMQNAMLSKRLRDLAELTTGGEELQRAIIRLGTFKEADGVGMFAMRESLEKLLPRDFDCVYI